MCDNVKSGAKKRLYRRKDRAPFEYPWKEAYVMKTPSQPVPPLDSGLDREELMLRTGDVDNPNEQPARPSPPKHLKIAGKESKPVTPASEPARGQAPPQSAGAKSPKAPPSKVPSSQGPPQQIAIHLDALLPAQFKRFSGKTWRELIQDPAGPHYLEWVANHFEGDLKFQAEAVMQEAAAKGGFGVLASM